MKEYMIVLKGSFADWNQQNKEQKDIVMAKYGEWVELLAGQERFVEGSELTSTVKRIRRINSVDVVDGPFPESKEALTGYFVIKAENLDEAVTIAHGCPALTHGDTVEVYEKPANCEV